MVALGRSPEHQELPLEAGDYFGSWECAVIRAAKNVCAGISGTPVVARFVAHLERRVREPSSKLRVLTYHRIGYPQQETQGDPELISATPESFREQMELLAERYQVLSMWEVLQAAREGGLLPPLAVLVTFDDSYRDFRDLAWPILRDLGLPVTLFVPTAHADRPHMEFWWDRLARAIRYADPGEAIELPCGCFPLSSPRRRQRAAAVLRGYLKTLPHERAMHWVDEICSRLKVPPRRVPSTLDWSELRQLQEEGVVLGAHTRTHPLLTRIDRQRIEEEVQGAKHDLDQHVGPCLPVFAYPAGAVGSAAPAILRAAGYELAWTTRAGASDLRRDDPLQLRRFHVGISTTTPLLRARLASA